MIYRAVRSRTIKNSGIKKIVLVMPSIGMGEVVFISKMVGIIRKNMPMTSITFISREYSCSFLKFIPGVKECVAFEDLGFSMVGSAGSGLMGRLRYLTFFPRFFLLFKRRAYDLAVVAGRGRFFTTWLYFVLRLAGTGEIMLVAKILKSHLDARTHVIDTYKAILEEMGLEVGEDTGPSLTVSGRAEEEARKFLFGKKIEPGRQRIIGICPLSTRAIKNWSPANFIALMERLGEDPDVRFLVFAHGDDESVRPFTEGAGEKAIVLGDLSFERLIALIKECDIFISVDTGPMHIASAFGIPTVGIFGPTSADMYGPFGKGNIALSADVSGCRYFDPTFMGSGKVQLCYSEDRCLIDSESCVNRVSVEDVLTACSGLLPRLRSS